MEDVLLWKSFKKGDRVAFEALFNKNYKGLYQYGFKLIQNHQLIDDGIQDLFFELWTGKENLPDVQSVRGYLFRGLRYKLFRQAQKKSRYDVLSEDYVSYWETSYESLLIDEERDRALHQQLSHFLQQLSPRQREAITLRFTNQMSYEEISDVMSISYQAVVNLVYKSLKYLRENMVSLPGIFLVLSFFQTLLK
jgi:RNA polymerase sigma factor (sigma-70 family)